MAQEEPNREAGSKSLSATLELAGKAVGAFGIVVYVCGFLIISLHQSEYGFTETNPFHSRIISAGLWFLLFLIVPLLGWRRVGLGRNWRGALTIIFPYYVLCVLISTISSEVLFMLPPKTWERGGVWQLLFGIGFFAFVLISSSIKVLAPIIPWLSIALVVCFVYKLLGEILSSKQLQFGAVVLWTFGVGLAAERIYQGLSRFNPREKEWAFGLVLFLSALSLFARYFYPNMTASWGGGKPVSIVMYFSSQSAVKPGQKICVQLLDESDVGFYILAQGEKKAVFIPRSSVSAVSYSDKTSESTLLQ